MGDKEDLHLRIRQLERGLTAVTKERDDLAKDVEQLCLSRLAWSSINWMLVDVVVLLTPTAANVCVCVQGLCHVFIKLRGIRCVWCVVF